MTGETEWMVVRGIRVLRSEIEAHEQNYGAKLVPDDEVFILANLDEALAHYRGEHGGEDPDFVILRDNPFVVYKHASLKVNYAGLSIPVVHKPAWFRWKRIFRGVNVAKIN